MRALSLPLTFRKTVYIRLRKSPDYHCPQLTISRAPTFVLSFSSPPPDTTRYSAAYSSLGNGDLSLIVPWTPLPED